MILQVKEITVVFFKQLLDHFPNSNTKIKKLTEEKIKTLRRGSQIFSWPYQKILNAKTYIDYLAKITVSIYDSESLSVFEKY